MKSRHPHRAGRVVAGLAVSGIVAGLSLAAATPASAVAECTADNTFDGATSSWNNVRNFVATEPELVCLSGTFGITIPMQPRADLTIRGVGQGATIDGLNLIRTIDSVQDISLTIENLTVTRGFGTAISNVGPVTVRDSRFIGNTGTYAGAISAEGPVTVTGSEFVGNEVDYVGGAIYGYGTIDIRDSTFEDNVGDQGGAVLAADDEPVTVVNSTFVGNTGSGPALLTINSSITTSTFLDNSTGAVWARDSIALVGNIFSADGGQQIQTGQESDVTDGGGNVFTSSASDESFAPSASTVFDADAADIFATGELADNGGPTRTLALNPDGPAIGVVPAGAPLLDQRGVPRPTPADAGAFEAPAPVPVPVAPVQPALAETGADTSPFIALGLSLFAGAAALLTVGRRQTRRSTIRS